MKKLEHAKTLVPNRGSRSISPERNKALEKDKKPQIKRTFCYNLLHKIL